MATEADTKAEKDVSTLIGTTKHMIEEVREDLLPIASAQFYCLVAEMDSSNISPLSTSTSISRSLGCADYTSATVNPNLYPGTVNSGYYSTSDSGSIPIGTPAITALNGQAGSPACPDLIVRSPDLNFLAVYMTGFCSASGRTGTDQQTLNDSPLAVSPAGVGIPVGPTDVYSLQIYDNWRNRNWFPVSILGSLVFGQPRRPYRFPKGFIIPAGTTIKFTITNLQDADATAATTEDQQNIRLAQFVIMGYLLPKASHRSRG